MNVEMRSFAADVKVMVVWNYAAFWLLSSKGRRATIF